MTDERHLVEWARAYMERGYQPIPLKAQDKYPEVHAWQRQVFSPDQLDTAFTPDKNIGLKLGTVSAGLVDVDLDVQEAVRFAGSFLPKTPSVFGRAGKPSSHWLYHVELEDGEDMIRREQYTDVDGAMLLEIRGDAHQTMVPPSIHPSSELLTWESDDVPLTVTIKDLKKRAGWLASAVLLGRHWMEWDGQRHNIALAISGALINNGVSAEKVTQFIHIIGAISGDPDIADRLKAVASTEESLAEGKPTTGFPTLSEKLGPQFVRRLVEWWDVGSDKIATPLTDHGNALRFVQEYKESVKFVPEWNQWLIWDGTRWKPDVSEQVMTYARSIPQIIYEEIPQTSGDDQKNALSKWAHRTQDLARLNAMIRIARTDPTVVIDSNELNASPWLLNVPNGTINLQTGALHQHDPRDLITKMTEVPYHPEAKAPRWEKFLLDIMDGDEELVAFIRRLAGYSLTGSTREQVFVLAWGLSGTGKSTLFETLRRVMGEYGRHAEAETIMSNERTSRATPELVQLQGARMVTAAETEENKRLAIARVKHITGGDTITAAPMYKEPISFKPVLKLWLMTNHKPRIPADEGGIWDRMVLIPFMVQMRDRPDRIYDMEQYLTPELTGILNWAVEGCREWLHDGLQRPDKVREAKSSYQHDSDEMADFLDELTVTDPAATVSSSQLYASYKSWATGAGYYPLNNRRFKEKMEARGFTSSRQAAGIVWKGLKMADVVVGDVIDLTRGTDPFGKPRKGRKAGP